MKKILSDKSFWIILVISIVTLILLTVGVIFLTRENTKEFYSSGYIINSTASKSDKYFFDDNTVYKENVFNEYVFKDVDDKEVSTGKDNFIHYNDNSLSFMKNGVILDLDNFNENIVPYYNITDKSIVKYNNGGYYVETADKTLVFGNFLGRITDNKYIVVGRDISVKLAGNDTAVKGDYFEILFVENGIVKIENQEGSYQTVTDGTIIYIGDNIKINLGDKSVSYGDEIKLSLSELTIDGNENIDIEPDTGKVKEDEEDNDGEGVTGGTGSGGTGSGDGDGTGQGNDSFDGTGEGNGTGEDGSDVDGETNTVLRKEVSVNLIQASSSVNSIDTMFQVIDTAEAIDGDLTVNLVNTTTGEVRTLTLYNEFDEQPINFGNLLSDNNYVMTITDESGVQYFQKSFRTNALDLKLKRELVTRDSLTYSLDFGENNDILSADITLFDKDGNKIKSYTVMNGTDGKVTFDGLENNTEYKVVVDNVDINHSRYNNIYTSTTTDTTLKNKPALGEASVLTNDEDKTFALKLDSVTDEDNAIVNYTYEIYKCEPNDEDVDSVCEEKLVYSFTRSELDEEFLRISEIDELYSNTDYKFKVVALYYDNSRYNEIESNFSSTFNVVGAPTISFEKDVVDFDRISGTVVINDVDCTVPFEGRECYNEKNNFIVYYREAGTRDDIIINNVTVNPENQSLYFDLSGLHEDTEYIFGVKANVDLKDEVGLRKEYLMGEFMIKTSSISELTAEWKDNDYSYENPISVTAKLKSLNEEDNSIDKLGTVTFKLYTGGTVNSTPIASYIVDGETVKELFYSEGLSVPSGMFKYIDPETGEELTGVNLDVLKMLSGGNLLEKYTIQITDVYDKELINNFIIDSKTSSYVYKTPAILLLENEVTLGNPKVTEIYNKETRSGNHPSGIAYNSELDNDTIVGYEVYADFYPNEIEKRYPITKINFYAYDSKGTLIETKVINYLENQSKIIYFALEEGTLYNPEVSDDVLRRGNTYTFAYDISIDEDSNSETTDLIFPASKPTSDPVAADKQEPSFKFYIDNSTETSVTYKYKLYDYDNALLMDEDGNYYIHYSVNDSEEMYKALFVKDGSSDTFTLSNLVNSSIYTINYYRTVNKEYEPSLVTVGSYFFDGYYNPIDYNIGYRLVYGNNRLSVVIAENEFLNRISAYLLTLTSDDNKYQTVITTLSACDVNVTEGKESTDKCIDINYRDISEFKGKDVTVTLEAFYDTGYVGFGQDSKLGSYFEGLGLVDSKDASKVGFVYQTTGTNAPGKYFYVDTGKFSSISDTPKGILGFELIGKDNYKSSWVLNSSNLLDINNNKFTSFGNIALNNSSVWINSFGSFGIENSDLTVNTKVLDKTVVQTEDDSFKFNSIIPEVSASVKRLINGGIMRIELTVDPETLASDFVKDKNGKYKFYVELFTKQDCSNLEEGEECSDKLISVKNGLFETDYDHLSEVVITGLDPNTRYYYKISAVMKNEDGVEETMPLFKINRNKPGYGYDEFVGDFTTLNKDDIFDRVAYSYDSNMTEETYSERLLTITSYLKTNTNFDLRYDLYDIDGISKSSCYISNDKIVVGNNNITARCDRLITDIEKEYGKEFVFGTNYHNLVITAVTPEKKELELYNDKLGDSRFGEYFSELKNPTTVISTGAGIDIDVDKNNFYITSKITIDDPDKVAKDGKFYIELTDDMYASLCPGHEDDCKITFKAQKVNGQYSGTCDFTEYSKVEECNVNVGADKYIIDIKFSGLEPETKYLVNVSTDTYRNNYTLAIKEETLKLDKPQFTNSDLKFSLGNVTPTVLSENKLLVSFVGAANLNGNIVGIDYSISATGLGPLETGATLGRTTIGGTNTLKFDIGADGSPTLTITLDEAEFTKGYTNTMRVTYYYEVDGVIYKLKFGDNTSISYTFGWGDK